MEIEATQNLEGLEQMIVAMSNRIDELEGRIGKGKYSNLQVYNGNVQINGDIKNSTETLITSEGAFNIPSIALGTELAIQGWTSTLVFSSSNSEQVDWTAGTIILTDGTVFNIDAGNTGAMTAGQTYFIYLDKNTSETVLQKSVTAANSVGANKILVAVATPNTDTTSKATFQAFGGRGGALLAVDNIAANSASFNELISNSAQIKDAIITNAKIISLGVDKLAAGTITSKIIALGFTDGAGDVAIYSSGFDLTNWRGNDCVAMGIDDSDSNHSKFFVGDYYDKTYIKWNGDHFIQAGISTNDYYGDGSDGDVVISTNTTLTRDMYYENLTINSEITLYSNGWRIFVLNKLSGSGTIDCSGADGSEGGTYVRNQDSVGGAGGAGGGASGSFFGQAPSGGAGGGSICYEPYTFYTGTGGVAGVSGTSKNPSLGSSGALGGDGGDSFSANDYYQNINSGGAAGVATTEQLTFGIGVANYSASTSLKYIKPNTITVARGLISGIYLSHSAGSGGGNGGLNYLPPSPWTTQTSGGGGGGAGGTGGIIYVAAYWIVAGIKFKANGGAGGRGHTGSSFNDQGYTANSGAGGGGAGGSGGVICVLYSQGSLGYINDHFYVGGGTGGTHGAAGAQGATNGANGNIGKLYLFNLR